MKKTSLRAPALGERLLPFVTDNPRIAFMHFKDLAAAEPVNNLDTLNADATVVLHNVTTGVEALRPHAAVIERKLPECATHELFELPALALALIYSTGLTVTASEAGTIDENLKVLRPQRSLLLEQFKIFAALKLVPKKRVEALIPGHGPLDQVRDCIAMVGMFTEFATELHQKHPFTPELIDEVSRRSNWLLLQLRPSRAASRPVAPDPAAILRDQLWTMVRRRHDQLREAAVVVFGLRKLDENVPPLNSKAAAAVMPPRPARAGEVKKPETKAPEAPRDDE